MKHFKSRLCKITLLFCMLTPVVNADIIPDLAWYETWPELSPPIVDPIETAFVEERLSHMTLEEKVGQMLMVEHNAVTPEEAKQYKIGAMLHAGGQAEFYGTSVVSLKCRQADYLSLSCWGQLADAYWHALKNAAWNDNAAPVPVLWSTDAMHGAGAIHGATLFPHNIGLGAAIVGNPDNLDLYKQMHAATREQVALQGFRQIFGPAVSVARNTHWGRTYESLSENPVIQYQATPYAVAGIQTPWMDGSPQRIAATLKHFVGDGGTTTGTGHTTKKIDSGYDPSDSVFLEARTDRGLNQYSESLLMNLHAPGYFSGIEAGAMSVMVSYNSWENGPLHGDRYLIQSVLKDRLKFDGMVVTDWEAITEVPGCTVQDCPQAINAGIDSFMIGFAKPNAWKDFYYNTIAHVQKGDIPMSRIDDAARRMLRVKYRLGFFTEQSSQDPSKSYLALGYETIEEAQKALNKWVTLAYSLAVKSMVLMKNNDHALPLNSLSFTKDAPLLVAGNALDSPAMQVGGWSLFWQGFARGDEDPFHNKMDYPQTRTVLDALKTKGIAICEYAPKAPCLSKAKTALVVMGEHSYAEWYGDIHVGESGGQSIAYQSIREEYAENEKLVETLKQQGYTVITVFYSGRPLVVDALNHSDAFIAGFLPGSQGGTAVVNLLFGNEKSFEGRLPYTWPAKVEDSSTFHGKPGHFLGDDNAWMNALAAGNAKEVLPGLTHPYPYGYGLDYEFTMD